MNETYPQPSFYLDYNRHYPVHTQQTANGVSITISGLGEATPRFKRHLEKMLLLGGHESNSTVRNDDEMEMQFPAPQFPAALTIAGREIVTLSQALEPQHLMPLSVTEARMIGTYHAEKLPQFLTSAPPAHTYANIHVGAKGKFLGDFHTHSSGQISAAGMLEVARAHDAYYPIYLLEKIGIEKNSLNVNGNTGIQPRVKFMPLEPQKHLPDDVECIKLSALTPVQFEKLRRSMAIHDTEIQTFAETEVPAYEMRYPLTKNKALIDPLLKRMARESAAAGLKHIELSYAGLENPELFEAVHHALREIEQDPATQNIKIYLKYGIPRTYSKAQITACLEKAKAIVQSPYVTGIDFLGYEDSATNEFLEPMTALAKWAHTHKPDLFFCVHAGETDKHPSNVIDALKFAKKMADEGRPITLRIGHGVYGMSKEALDIAGQLAQMQPPRVFIELNPDSNMALNNIIEPKDIMPMVAEFMCRGIPFVPGSDSFGQYQTDLDQLVHSFLIMGFTQEYFQAMHGHQETLLQQLNRLCTRNKQALQGWDSEEGLATFCAKTVEALKKIPDAHVPKNSQEFNFDGLALLLKDMDITLCKPDDLPPELQDKKPITLIGASGKSWERISPGHQHEIAVAADMLIHAMDPSKAYIAQGRNKSEGLSAVINRAAEHAQSNDKALLNVGFQADIKIAEDEENPYAHLTHMIALKKRTHIPDAIADFTVRHDGILVAFGGGAYTRDTILKADISSREQAQGWVYTMQGPHGASTDKARTMGDKYVFASGVELLQKIYREHKDLFRSDLNLNDRATLEQLHDGAVQRVRELYPPPSPDGQQVGSIQLPQPEIGVGK